MKINFISLFKQTKEMEKLDQEVLVIYMDKQHVQLRAVGTSKGQEFFDGRPDIQFQIAQYWMGRSLYSIGNFKQTSVLVLNTYGPKLSTKNSSFNILNM